MTEMSSEELDEFTTDPDEGQTPEQEPEEKPAEKPEEKPAEQPEEKPEESVKTDAELALEETEDQKPTVLPEHAVIGGMRREIREANKRAAIAETRLEERAPKVEAEKSPMELEAEKQDKPIDEILVDGKLYKEQQAWEKRQDEAATQQKNLDDFSAAARDAHRTMTDAVHGKGLGLESLETLGAHLLTQGDQLDIYQSGKNCGKVMMERLKYRILQAGGANAVELRARLNAKKPQAEPKPGNPKPKVPKPNNEDSGLRDSTVRIMDELAMER